jgi:hypothetical protein
MYNNRLIDIIIDSIDYTEYKLNEDEKKWIYCFINEMPETLNELDTDIQTITEDMSIKIDDIPTIIKIIADTYYLAACNKESVNPHNLYIFIKYTICVILDSKLLILSTKYDRERLHNIIDSSMILLNMDLHVTNKRSSEIDNNYCRCFFQCSSIRKLFINNFNYKTT